MGLFGMSRHDKLLHNFKDEFDVIYRRYSAGRTARGEPIALSDIVDCYSVARRNANFHREPLTTAALQVLTLDAMEHVRVRTSVPPDLFLRALHLGQRFRGRRTVQSISAQEDLDVEYLRRVYPEEYGQTIRIYHSTDSEGKEGIEAQGFALSHVKDYPGHAWFQLSRDSGVTAWRKVWWVIAELPADVVDRYRITYDDGTADEYNVPIPWEVVNRYRPFAFEHWNLTGD